jgi:DnaK suppressor protein
MLNEDTIRLLESKLRIQHAQIKAALSVRSGDKEFVSLDQTRVNPLLKRVATAQQEMSAATRAPTQTELRRIDAAIGRLTNGRYGVCCQCQDRIEVSLLQSDPATPFCLPCCEEMMEERQSGRRRS